MITNLNDLLRNKISTKLSNKEQFEIIEYFYSLTEDEQANILRLALADFYKIYYYSNRKIHGLFKLKIEDVIDYCIVDVGSAIYVLDAIKVFNDMDYVSKCLIMETLENYDQDNNVRSVYKLHDLDKLTYQIVDDIENYKEYYKNYLEYNKEKPNRISVIGEFISYRMLELIKINPKKYQKYILEFIKEYYKWKNFIKMHVGKHLLNNFDFDYLDKIENNSLDELLNLSQKDFDFLFTLVIEYLHYTTEKMEIKEEIVDDYFIKGSSNELKEKLKCK